MPIGVLDMSMDIENLVETSNNLAVLSTDDDYLTVVIMARSSSTSKKEAVKEQVSALAGLLGASFEGYDEYPAWEYNPNSELRENLLNLYEEMFNKKPHVEATHAGLECGLLSEKLPGADIISFGPDIFDVHTPDEHFSVSSAARMTVFLARALTRI